MNEAGLDQEELPQPAPEHQALWLRLALQQPLF